MTGNNGKTKMMYIFGILLILLGICRASHNEFINSFSGFDKCTIYDQFRNLTAECFDLEPVVNIDVLSVSRPLQPPVNTTRVLCVGEPIIAVLRFTPREGQELGNSTILWGDVPYPEVISYVPCGSLPAPLDALPHDPRAQCAIAQHIYNISGPGSYPAAIFSENAFGKQVQIEGFININRCYPSGELGLLTIVDTSGTDGILCLQNDVSAQVVASASPGAVVLAANFGGYQGLPGNALIWWGGLPIADFVTEFPANGLVQAVNPPYGNMPKTGNVPTVLILRTNEEQIQIDGFVYVENCVN